MMRIVIGQAARTQKKNAPRVAGTDDDLAIAWLSYSLFSFNTFHTRIQFIL